MQCFGWRIADVLNLTWPQFEYISTNIARLGYWRAKNEVFFGVTAALGGEDSKKNLFACAGEIVTEPEINMDYTAEDLAAPRKRMQEILAQRRAMEDTNNV